MSYNSKYILFKISLMSLFLSSNAISTQNPTDPFIKTWLRNDGLHSYHLYISKSNAPGQKYSVKYNASGNSFESDICNPVSDLSIQCVGNVLLTRDDPKHSIVVATSDEQFRFYDSEYVPALSAYIGAWNAEYHNPYDKNDITYFGIKIMVGSSEKEVLINDYYRDTRGNFCGGSNHDGIPNTYEITENTDGTLLFATKSGGFGGRHYFVFDLLKKQIKPYFNGRYYDIGECIFINDDIGKTISFTKA